MDQDTGQPRRTAISAISATDGLRDTCPRPSRQSMASAGRSRPSRPSRHSAPACRTRAPAGRSLPAIHGLRDTRAPAQRNVTRI